IQTYHSLNFFFPSVSIPSLSIFFSWALRNILIILKLGRIWASKMHSFMSPPISLGISLGGASRKPFST
ncbi:hypothetical protein PFISCL1PPCAC_22388, partial [Pristionchus fissidentatus]